MNRFFWIFLIILFGCFNLKAQNNLPPVFEIKADTAAGLEVPDKNWQILEDPTEKLTIAQVSSLAFDSKFHINNTRIKGYDYSITNYWLRYTFKNTLTHQVKIYLKETVAYAYLYTRKPDSTWSIKTTGTMVPFDKRDGLDKYPGFVITIDPGQQITCYEKDVFDFRIGKPEAFILHIGFWDAIIKRYYINDKKTLSTAILDTLTLGMLLMTALINLLFFRIVKEKTYLFFSLFLIFLGSYYFLCSSEAQFLIYKEHLYVYIAVITLLYAGYLFFLMQFIRNYLTTYIFTPKLDKVLLFLGWTLAVLMIAEFILPTTLSYKTYQIIIYSINIILSVYFPILLFTMLYYLRINKQARAGTYAALPIMSWISIVYAYMYVCELLHQFYKVPFPRLYNLFSDWDEAVSTICYCWLVMVFSWILFKRYQDLQKSFIQSSLDREVERNQLIAKQNEELEKQVEVRTAELKQSLNELKTTQQQLIQSEKLASLGELTAGIAHEIQNPLNFVNNFSEVSMELAVEMKTELTSGSKEEAISIANDIEQNLEKIIHHGKRADAIVKNMLQHSRNNSAEKQLTDINALADEYLRLSYHGLRAKDKSFNANMVADLDPNIPQVDVIPQDIGRVLLNLFNNAFYAVQQRKIKEGGDYKPEVSVTTAINGKFVEIKVRDNGTGIPDNVKGKIMQPFFTTKPTGEGTGLGLSLSYDILVKGHGGTIEIDSKEGEYTEFTIKIPA